MSIEANNFFSAHLLEPFFAPKGVAVIGASPTPGNLGKRIVESLLSQGYEGAITIVHPQGHSLPGCDSVSAINDLPEITDLAIAAVSADHVNDLIEPLAIKGVQNLIVIGGGFAETDDAGRQLQNELVKLCSRWGIRTIGPNCLGTFSSQNRFNSFFLSPDEIRLPDCGPVAIISQSGAFMSTMLDQLSSRHLGVHRAINFGNRTDIGECEALESFGADPAVNVIGVYLESLQDGRRFLELAQSITRKKTIVICKGGKVETCNRAVQAHSASLAGSYPVFQTACEQAGMVEVQGLAELINALHLFSVANTRQGNRVLIVSNGGGMGVMLADLCSKGGCIVDEPPVEVQKELKETLPGFYSLKNPVDLTVSGTNEQCVFALEKLLNSGMYDCLLMVILSGTEGINAEIIPRLNKVLPKDLPMILGAYGKDMYPKVCEYLRGKKIPVFPSGEEAAWAVNLLCRAGSQKASLKKYENKAGPIYRSAPLQSWLSQGNEVYDEMTLKQKLSECGIRIPGRLHIRKSEDLHKAVNEIGFPLMLKVIGEGIQHKTELKGIRSDLYKENDLYIAWKDMNDAWPNQIWVEEQMPPGLDLMIGVHRDPDFGPVIVFGTGGKYVELYQDIKQIILPAENDQIMQAIFRTKAGSIIQGIRSEGPLDIQKLLAFINLIAEWVEAESRLLSLDLNPVRLYSNSMVVLDAKMTSKNNFRD